MSDFLRGLFCIVMLTLLHTPWAMAQDTALTNYKSGIDVVGGGAKGVDYQEEYQYYDKLVSDMKQVWIRSSTPITMGHNARNMGAVSGRDRTVIGAAGGGQVRYKIDGIWQELAWAPSYDGTGTIYPAYTAPFTLASTGAIGVTGYSGSFWRGMVDSAGDEWHVLMYGDDDSKWYGGPTFAGSEYDDSWASDGKYVLLCVDPKTPALTVRAGASGQFYTTPAWTYWTAKIHNQTTYFQGACTFQLNNIYGGNISYKINDGAAVAAGAATATLNESHFNDGSNTLAYWYTSTPNVVRTRSVVKNPTHPGLAEGHGNRIWGGAGTWAKFQARIARLPYRAAWVNAQTGRCGQTSWDTKRRSGLLFGSHSPHSNYSAGTNALMAKQLGWSAYLSGAIGNKTYAAYAKEMLLEASLSQANVGYEADFWASQALPCAATVYRGYWDVNEAYTAAMAYDVLMGGFRSDQVSGGISPVEDCYLRDQLAAWVHLCGLTLGGFVNPYGGGGMWTTSRMVGATMIACVMPAYSTPYYGTCGLDGNTTVYPWTPFPTQNYTWKDLYIDHDNALAAIGTGPHWSYGMEGTLSDGSLIRAPIADAAFTGTNGEWVDKVDYASYSQCGHNIYTYANLIALYSPENPHPYLINFLNEITAGTLRGSKAPTGPIRQHALPVLHERFPQAAANATTWIQGLASSDANSDDIAVTDAGLYGIFFYDDAYYGGPATPVVATPVMSPAYYNGNSNPVTVTLTCATTGAAIHYTTDGSEPTASSPVYAGPLSLTGTTTLLAMGFKSGANPSIAAIGTFDLHSPSAIEENTLPSGNGLPGPATVFPLPASAGVRISLPATGCGPVEIHTQAGGLVAVLNSNPGSPLYAWDGFDQAGRRTEPGLYIYSYEYQGAVYSGKFIKAQ